MSNVAESGEEHSMKWGMFIAATMNAAKFMGMNFSTNQNFTMNSEDLMDKIHWEKNSWKRLSLIGDETVINLQSTKSMSSRILCCVSGGSFNIPNPAWKNRVAGVRAERSYKDHDAINGEPIAALINDLLSDLGQTPETFTRRILFMSKCVTKTKMNAWQMPKPWKNLREDLVLDNGHLLHQVLKRSGILQRIVHNEWAWDHIVEEIPLKFEESGHPTFRATTPLSRGILKSKERGKLSTHFAADRDTIDAIYCIVLVSISSVFTEQWLPYVKNLRIIKMDRVNLRFWWVNQLFSVKLRQRFLCRMTTLQIIKFFGNSTWNELSRFHQKAKWVDSVWKQDLCVLLKWDNISSPRTLEFSDNVIQWLVVNSLFLEMIQLHNQKDGFKHENWTCVGSHNQFSKLQLWNWNSNLVCGSRQFSILGQNILWNDQTRDRQIRTTQKFLHIHKKIKCHKQVSRLLQPDQKQKQNHNRENLLILQLSYRCTKENGLILSHQNPLSLRTKSRRKWSIFFNTNKQYSGKKMEQFNSGELNFIFEIIPHKYKHWSDDRWKSCLASGGSSKRRNQYFSDNSGRILHLRALQGHSGTISLILRYRTM